MIIDRIYEWARIQPNKNAIIWNDIEISYAWFARLIEITRRFLERQHLPRGSTCALVIRNLADCWIVCIAARAIGLNTISLRNASQARQLEIRDLSCFVTVEAEVRDLASPQSANARIINIPISIYSNASQDDLPVPLEINSIYGGHILYTSGTTGAYKKLLWHASDEEQRATARAKFHQFDARTVLHNLAYLWTGAGFKRPLSVWRVGGCVVFDQTPDFLSKFFQHGITNALILPSTLDQLLSTHKLRLASSVRPTLNVGGSVLSPHQVLRALDQLNSDVIIEYSATELSTPPLMSIVRNEDDIVWLWPQAGRDISIVNEELASVAPNEEGILRIALNNLDFESYYDEPGGKSAFNDGYFYPGDMAVKRADGRIQILGRIGDVINIGGTKFAVAPIEQRLQRHLGADEVCLFAHLNDTGQEELIVAIQSSSAPAQAKLDDVRREFSAFESVKFHVLNEFPRTDTGTAKVQRVILKNLLTKRQ